VEVVEVVEGAAVEAAVAAAVVVVVAAVVEEVAVAVVVLALRSPDTPIHRKVERHQSPQVLRSISYRLG
jgi:hypothetical protein